MVFFTAIFILAEAQEKRNFAAGNKQGPPKPPRHGGETGEAGATQASRRRAASGQRRMKISEQSKSEHNFFRPQLYLNVIIFTGSVEAWATRTCSSRPTPPLTQRQLREPTHPARQKQTNRQGTQSPRGAHPGLSAPALHGKVSDISLKKSWPSTSLMRYSRSTPMLPLRKILYTFERSQGILAASQQALRPCSRSTSRIRFPKCIIDIGF